MKPPCFGGDRAGLKKPVKGYFSRRLNQLLTASDTPKTAALKVWIWYNERAMTKKQPAKDTTMTATKPVIPKTTKAALAVLPKAPEGLEYVAIGSY